MKLATIDKLKAAWQEYQKHGVDKHGLEFGKKLFDLRAAAEVVQGGTTFNDDLKEAGIPRSTAYYWLGAYEQSIGWEKLHKEKRQHRGEGAPFEVTQKLALDILTSGFKDRLKKEPEKQHQIQASKDWAMARLKSAMIAQADPVLRQGMTFALNSTRYQVIAEPTVSPDDVNRPLVIELQVKQIELDRVKKAPCVDHKVTTGSLPTKDPVVTTKSTQGNKSKPVDPKKDLLKRFYAARRAEKFFTTMLGEARCFVASEPQGMGSSYGEFLEEYPSADKYLLKPPTKDYTLPKTIEELEAEDKKAFEEFQKVFQEGKAMGVLTDAPREKKSKVDVVICPDEEAEEVPTEFINFVYGDDETPTEEKDYSEDEVKAMFEGGN